MPAGHRDFLAILPWVAEAEGHIFLHNGFSPELDCPASTSARMPAPKDGGAGQAVEPAIRHRHRPAVQPGVPGVAGCGQAALGQPAAAGGEGAGERAHQGGPPTNDVASASTPAAA